MKLKKIILFFLAFSIFLVSPLVINNKFYAKEYVDIPIEPTVCTLGSCPTGLSKIYEKRGETCVASFEEFKKNPSKNHFWINDPKVTTQGKADERARQFLYWAIKKNSVDNHPVIKSVWKVTKNVAISIFVLIGALFGIGYIIGQKTNFQLKIQIAPSLTKIGTGLLYIVFSFSIVIILIQVSDIVMKFFIEKLGGTDLFNIYFSSINQEQNYISFTGCRDINYQIQESVKTQLLLLKLTNVSYYTIGSLFILRKIILWFMIFVSPFLAILLSFSLIKNVGWIWIRVFFQWLFYGPLFSIFLGTVSVIWKKGVPFVFDFSRAGKISGYVFPSGTNILLGGPAQILGITNNLNYIDTFVEYITTLLMLWAAIILPWFLLRTFQDYCCDGIRSIKNILLSSLNKRPQGPSPNVPSPKFNEQKIGNALKMIATNQMAHKTSIETKFKSIEKIKQTSTQDIKRSLSMSAPKLTQVAQIETNENRREQVSKNIDYLTSPTTAKTNIEKQIYMNLKNELYDRAVKQDSVAQRFVRTFSASQSQQNKIKNEILKTVPKLRPITRIISIRVKLPEEKVSTVTSSIINSTANNNDFINKISVSTKLPPDKIKLVLTLLIKTLKKTVLDIPSYITNETKIEKNKVLEIIEMLSQELKTNKEMAQEIANKFQIKIADVENILDEQIPIITNVKEQIEKAITIPTTISIEEYENVKKMWIKQYEEGEIPKTENFESRQQWIEADIALITNTLNKLLSNNDEIRQQGLDDVGYILPIFLVNNFDGQQLVVYLRAKLEAGKQVKENIVKEKEITERLRNKTEEISVPLAKKKEASKTMEMKQEIEK